ncbi:MAG: tetratricopeptide repeat protein [Halioglobus sp.]|nr:tetratricopeptide repeat protein [Halioglobus sp.]
MNLARMHARAAHAARRTLLAAVLLCTACSEDMTAEDHLQRARELSGQADATAAYIELKNVMALDQGIAEAHWLLGELYLNTGNAKEAEQALQRAAELGWRAGDVRPALASTLLELRRPDDVLALATDDLDDGARASVLAIQAMALLEKDDRAAAADLAREALKLDPAGELPVVALATVLLAGDKAVEARVLLQAGLDANLDNPRGWHLMGHTQLALGQYAAARDAFSEAVARKPVWSEPLLYRALANVKLGAIDAARKDAATLAEIAPDTPEQQYLQGLIHGEDRQYREAANALTNALPVEDKFPLIHHALARALLFNGDDENAFKYVKAYLERFPDNVDARKVRGVIHFRARDYDAARLMLQPVLDQNPSELESLYLMAVIEAREGELDQSLTLFTWLGRVMGDTDLHRVVRDSELVAVALQQAPLTPGDEELAIEDKIIEIFGKLAAQDHDGAIDIARNLQWADATGLGGYHVLTRVYLLAGRQEEAMETMEKAFKRDPHDPVSHLFLAEQALQDDNVPGARSRYKQILAQYPYHLQTLLRSAVLDARQGKDSIFTARLLRAMHAHPRALAPRLALAAHYLRQGDAKDVPFVFELLSGLQRLSPRVAGLELVAALAQGEDPIEQSVTDRLVNAQPGTDLFYSLLVATAQQKGRLQDVEAVLLRIMAHSRNHVPTLTALAMIARAQGEGEKLVRYVRLLEQVHPDPASTVLLQLQVAALTAAGDSDKALALARTAHQSEPGNVTLRMLVSYLLRAGETAEAVAVMRDWLQDNPADTEIHLRVGQLLEADNDLQAAQSHYRSVLEAEPDNAVALNNLAWILRQSDPQQALALGRRALLAAPQQPQVMDTLAVIEHLNGQSERALAILERALRVAPGDTTARYHKGMILAQSGRQAEARQVLTRLLQSAPQGFAERAQAQQLLQNLPAQAPATAVSKPGAG